MDPMALTKAQAKKRFVPLTATSAREWRTSADATTRQVAGQADYQFGPIGAFPWQPLTVDPGQRYQDVVGFGAALTDASAYLLQTQISAAQRATLLRELFDPTQGNLSIVRIPMGASDYSFTRYTYDDQPLGTTDPTLGQFSIAPDVQYRIATLREILAINPRVRILATPWSPPAWMKTDPTVGTVGSSVPAANYPQLANYFVKFIQAYQALGIPIWAITPQNEPSTVFSWPGCLMTAAAHAVFIGTYLGPAFDTAGINTKIIVNDDSWGTNTNWADTVLPDATAAPYIEGMAWHWYGNDPSIMSKIARKYPTKGHYFTEACGTPTTVAFTIANAYRLLFIGSMRNWAKTIILWNIALDQNGQPMNRGNGEILNGLYTVYSDGTGRIVKNTDYWATVQTSRFVRPGAVRVGSHSYSTGVQTVAYLNPDDSVTLVAWNSSASAITTQVVDARRGQGFLVTLPAGEVATYVWQGVAAAVAGPTLAAPSAPGLTIAAVPGRINLTITAPTTSQAPVSGYIVRRGTTSGQETILAALAPTATSYTDSPGTAGTLYFYTVAAVSAGGESAASTERSATAIAATVPTAISNLAASPTNSQISLTWTAPADGGSTITSYSVYRSTTSTVTTTGTPLASVPTTGATAYLDTALTNGSTYYYKVVAVNAVGPSAASNLVSAVPALVETRAVTKPSTTAQPALWLRSDQIPTALAAGTSVANWPDFSGSGKNAVLPSGAAASVAPTYTPGAINGYAALSFNRTTSQRIVAPQATAAESLTLLVVARYPVLGSNILVAGATNDTKVNGSINTYTNGSGSFYAQEVAASSQQIGTAPGLTAGNFGIAAASWDSAANSHVMKAVINGSTIASLTPTTYTATSATGFSIAGVGTDLATVDVAEVIVFTSCLSDADRHAWTSYLGQVYGITVGAN